jgi:hypothetical protein
MCTNNVTPAGGGRPFVIEATNAKSGALSADLTRQLEAELEASNCGVRATPPPLSWRPVTAG